MDWIGLKNEAWRLLLDKDALHIYAAALIQIVAAKLSGRTLGHVFPWLMVLGLELLNEWIDVLRGREPELRPWQVVSAIHDIINTMILPTILLVLCRKDRALFAYEKAEVAETRCSADEALAGTSSQPRGPRD